MRLTATTIASAIRLFVRKTSSCWFKHILFNVLLSATGALTSLWLAFNTGWRAVLLGGLAMVSGILVHMFMSSIKKLPDFIFRETNGGMSNA